MEDSDGNIEYVNKYRNHLCLQHRRDIDSNDIDL